MWLEKFPENVKENICTLNLLSTQGCKVLIEAYQEQ